MLERQEEEKLCNEEGTVREFTCLGDRVRLLVGDVILL